jgi:hypothetical protein
MVEAGFLACNLLFSLLMVQSAVFSGHTLVDTSQETKHAVPCVTVVLHLDPQII